VRRAGGAQHVDKLPGQQTFGETGSYTDRGSTAASGGAPPDGGAGVCGEPRIRTDRNRGAGGVVRVEGEVEPAAGGGAGAAEGEAGSEDGGDGGD